MTLEELQQDQDENAAECPVCESADAQVLGQLGNRIHLRCNGCGITFSHEERSHNE